MLIKYVRDIKERPVAVIVAFSPKKIGVFCFKEKQNFPKTLAWKTAMYRAMSKNEDYSHQIIVDKTFVPEYYDAQAGGNYPTLKEAIEFEVSKIIDRFNKIYFKLPENYN